MRTGFQRTFFLPVPGGVFGDGVVFAGILVALAGPFWPGGAAPRGVAIFVPVLASAPCKPKHGRGVFCDRESHCHLGSMPALLNHLTLTQSEAKTEVTLCLRDATNVFYSHKGLLGTRIHSPTRMPSALSSPPTGTVYMSYQHESPN